MKYNSNKRKEQVRPTKEVVTAVCRLEKYVVSMYDKVVVNFLQD